MADTADARREARRRKILENSSNRLQRISGKNECVIGAIKASVPEEVQNEPIYVSSATTNNGAVISEADHPCFFANHLSGGTADLEIVDDHIQVVTKSDTIQILPSYWQKCFCNKYDVIILSLLFQMSCSVFSMSFNNEYFFLPLILYAVTKAMFTHSQQESQMANILLLLNGISPQRVQRVIFILQSIGAFMQDMCIFLFSTICIQSLLVVLEEKLVT